MKLELSRKIIWPTAGVINSSWFDEIVLILKLKVLHLRNSCSPGELGAGSHPIKKGDIERVLCFRLEGEMKWNDLNSNGLKHWKYSHHFGPLEDS